MVSTPPTNPTERPGEGALDSLREASMADEGGWSAALIETEEPAHTAPPARLPDEPSAEPARSAPERSTPPLELRRPGSRHVDRQAHLAGAPPRGSPGLFAQRTALSAHPATENSRGSLAARSARKPQIDSSAVDSYPRARRAAFTLIELMIVIAILGILAAIAVPVMSGLIRRSKTAEVSEQLTSLFQRAAVYYAVEHAAQGTDGGITTACTVAMAGPRPIIPSVQKQSFEPDQFFQALNFSIGDFVYYSYAVKGPEFRAAATRR